MFFLYESKSLLINFCLFFIINISQSAQFININFEDASSLQSQDTQCG